MGTNLKIYRLEDSIWGKLFRKLRKPDMPAGTIILGHPIDTLKDFINDSNIYLLDKEQISKFINVHNESWHDNIYYIRHPKQAMERYLIRADRFLQYIEQQKLAEIIAYIRNNCNPHRISIETTDANGFKGHANGTLHLESESTGDSDNQINIDVGANASLNLRSYNKIEIICDDRIKPSEQLKNFIWIDDFTVLQTAIDNYNGGKIDIRQVIESNWYISADLAVFIGLAAKGSVGAGISSDSKYCLHIIVE